MFPLFRLQCLFINEKQLGAEIKNCDDNDVNITIPENWDELSHNERLDLVYKIQNILETLCNRYETEENEVLQFTVNNQFTVYVQNAQDDEDRNFLLRFETLYEDFLNLYQTSLLLEF